MTVSNQDFLDREPDDLERYLVEQGRHDRPADGVRQRTVVFASLAASTASAGLATASIASGSSAASAAPWVIAAKWVAIGVASGMATVGAAEGLRYQQRSDLATPPAVVLPAPTTPTARQPTRSMAPQGADEPSTPPLAPPAEALAGAGAQLARPRATERGTPVGAPLDETSRPTKDEPRAVAIENRPADAVVRDEARPVRAARPSGGVSNAEPPPQVPSSPPARDRERDKSLKSELGYLDEARIALEAHVAPSAMRLLDEYAQQFPSGSMRIEAIVLRIEALLVLGRQSDAQALGNDFLARYPASPAAMRVRFLLGPRDNTPSKR
jgi:hypothetical protein